MGSVAIFCAYEYNARSANRELEVLMKKHIADFEKAHGKIEIE
ncbi:hypothetical protein [Mediterraneibacter gnavus]|nr:hypothetical protein [Mediterraneibacter gnavus]